MRTGPGQGFVANLDPRFMHVHYIHDGREVGPRLDLPAAGAIRETGIEDGVAWRIREVAAWRFPGQAWAPYPRLSISINRIMRFAFHEIPLYSALFRVSGFRNPEIRTPLRKVFSHDLPGHLSQSSTVRG